MIFMSIVRYQLRNIQSSSKFTLHLQPFRLSLLFLFTPLGYYRARTPESLEKALRVLDLVSPNQKPKPNLSVNHQNHARLFEDFLQRHYPKQSIEDSISMDSVTLTDSDSRDLFDRIQVSLFPRRVDPISTLCELHREGLRFDTAVAISHAVSACGSTKSLECGFQLHCLAIRNGVSTDAYVGSSLISFYIKCDDLNLACKLFEEIPGRTVVSWTALMSGFAQEWRIDECIDMYNWMRISNVKPNEFTFTTILSASMGSGSLIKGRSIHSDVTKLGFSSYVHIANTLISMYWKCGNVKDAVCVFKEMQNKDVVSWNSMIAGYAMHGFGSEAIHLFEEMRKHGNIKPDAITFVGVLSSCRHSGFVDQGRAYFESMVEYGIVPCMDHYSCMVDLLGRAGLLEEARNFILQMPVQPTVVVWSTLLSACRLRRDVWLGIEAAERVLELEPGCAATHLQLSQLYAMAGMWRQAAEARKMIRDRQLNVNVGCSWVEIDHVVHQFRAEYASNVRAGDIIWMLGTLMLDHLYAADDLLKVPDEV